MKRHLFLLPILAMLFLQCETEPIDPVINVDPDPMPQGDEFEASIDGSDFEYDNLSVATTDSGGTTLISISAVDSSGQSLSLTIDEAAMTGNITLPDANGEATLIYTDGTTPYTIDSGNVNLQSLDTTDMTLSGTFSATFVDGGGNEPDVSISGSFDVSY